MAVNESKLNEYARLLVEVGINVQQGQTLIVNCPVEQASFARRCVAAAYERGAREVLVNWNDDTVTREKFLHADDAVFDEFPAFESERPLYYAKMGAGFLSLIASDPSNLMGVEPSRLLRSRRVRSAALQPWNELVLGGNNAWSIGALACPAWAKRVYPDLPADEAVDKLWDAIFDAVRVDGTGKAVEAWRAHVSKLGKWRDALNAYRFTKLHYMNALGTDLWVGLPKGHIWASGDEATNGGTVYLPNLPTEEIFTAPKRDEVDGVVYASLPLCLDGNVIRGIRFRLQGGRIVEAAAEEGEEFLKNAIAVDEGASFLGEAALVPFDSPISRSATLFYTTLFDENAACHFAFGRAYPMSVEGGLAMQKEELLKAGLNVSNTHVDFMIGTADLSVTGICADGREIPVLQNGNFAF